MTKPCVKCGAEERNNKGGCKACAKEAVRKWQKANPDKAADYKRKYREANSERVAEIQHKYYEANKEKIAEYARENAHKNRQKYTANARKWRIANPERNREINQNRRARIKGNGGKLSTNIVQKLLILQKGKCACCGASLGNNYHLDHIIPLALGGMNDDSNVQLLTPKCNMSKGSRHPIDYMRSKGRLI